MSRDNICPRQRLRCRRAEAWVGLDHHRGGPDCWRVDEREQGRWDDSRCHCANRLFLLTGRLSTSTTRHVVSSDRGLICPQSRGGIAELMVSGVDTSTCGFVAHKISLTCTSRVFLQLCGSGQTAQRSLDTRYRWLACAWSANRIPRISQEPKCHT